MAGKVVAGIFAADPLDAAATALVQAVDEKSPALRWAKARAVIGLVTQQVCQELLDEMGTQIRTELRELLSPILEQKGG